MLSAFSANMLSAFTFELSAIMGGNYACSS